MGNPAPGSASFALGSLQSTITALGIAIDDKIAADEARDIVAIEAGGAAQLAADKALAAANTQAREAAMKLVNATQSVNAAIEMLVSELEAIGITGG